MYIFQYLRTVQLFLKFHFSLNIFLNFHIFWRLIVLNVIAYRLSPNSQWVFLKLSMKIYLTLILNWKHGIIFKKCLLHLLHFLTRHLGQDVMLYAINVTKKIPQNSLVSFIKKNVPMACSPTWWIMRSEILYIVELCRFVWESFFDKYIWKYSLILMSNYIKLY